MRIRQIRIKGRFFEISDQGDVWRCEFTNGKGTVFPRLKLTASSNRGYRSICFVDPHGRCCKASVHRLVARAFLEDYHESLWVDHINGIRHDNRLENLRLVTPQGNHRGRYRKIQGASSRFRGVTWEQSRRQWKAAICINDKRINLGRFKTEHEAARAYDTAAITAGFYPEALNFPLANN